MARDYHIYVIAEVGDEYCKIGVSTNPGARLDNLRSGNPRRMTVHCTYPVPSRSLAFDVERESHYAMVKYRAAGEWFQIHPDEAQKVIGPIWRKMLDYERDRKPCMPRQLLATAGRAWP